jgi:hypothetical protein
MQEALESASPLHLVDSMPDVSYYIFHCSTDQLVNKELHSDKFVEQMEKRHHMTYIVVPDRDHCNLTQEMWDKYNDYILQAIEHPSSAT